MKFADYIGETVIKEPMEHRGKTSKDNGHYHDYFIKHVSGNGRTGKAIGKTKEKHTHPVKKMMVMMAAGHKHDIQT